MSAAGRLLVIAAVVSLAAPPNGASSRDTDPDPLRVVAVDSMTRVPLTGFVAGRSSVHLHAARGEWAPFQIVVAARGKDLTAVQADLEPFHGPGEAVIDTARLYREHALTVTTPSPFSPYPPGPHFDALIPFTNPGTDEPLSGQRFDAVPFDVADGHNQPLWVDVHVRVGAPPGDYTAELHVTVEGETRTLPVTLSVWAFSVPTTPSLRSSFWMADYQMSAFYDLDWDHDAAALYRITRRYYEILLAHRLMPTRPVDSWPAFDTETNLPVFDATYPGLGTAEQNLEHYVAGGATAVNLPFLSWWPFDDPLGTDRDEAIAYLSAVLDVYGQNGWQDVPYAYLFDLDEPNDLQAYDLVRRWGAFFDEVESLSGASIPMLVTEHPVPDDPAWGSLLGAVDIWVPCCDTVWLSDDLYGEGAVAERLAAGDEVWWYTALTQASGPWWAAHGYPDIIAGDNAPIWQLDYPPLNYRIAPWFAAQYGFTGLLYWQVACWSQTPWTDPATYNNSGLTYNGEGMLVYPGQADEIGFDGPVASMRLKWLREGMEDFEYLRLLVEAGEEAFVDDRLQTVARDMGDWEENPAAWLAVRHQLGERLHQLARTPRRTSGRVSQAQ